MTNSPTKELRIRVPAAQRDVLIALLSHIGYEGFWENEEGFHAYLPAADYDPQALQEVLDVVQLGTSDYSLDDLAAQNWNQSWEAHYPPVQVGNLCQIISDFHEELPDFRFTLRITPKMSFGTGHHATTQLMIRAMEGISLQDRAVLDMGTGTGVLAILAEKMGAKEVLAIDFDPWCFENASENAEINQCQRVKVALGDASAIPNQTFEVILANINRNVLLEDIPAYSDRLAAGGILLLSGFQPEDLSMILAKAEQHHLRFLQDWEEGTWMALELHKHMA